MRQNLKFVFFSFFLISSLDAYCNKDSKNVDLKLKSDLLCDYDNLLRPPANHTPIVLKYMLRDIEHDEYSKIHIESIIRQRWNDSRLKWSPENYEGIKGIYVQSDYIWMPKLFLNDSHYHYGLGSCHETPCLIKYDGDVICQFPCHQTARCRSDFTDWPFDIHTCSVVFRTFLSQEEVSFNGDEMSGSYTDSFNKQWKVLSAEGTMNRTDGTNVKFTFVIQRYAASIYKHVHIPGYVLIVMTLSVLWMKQGCVMRFVVCGSSIFLHFNLMDRVWWLLPTTGFGVPRLMKFMTLMLSLTTVVLIETIFLKLLTDSNSELPLWATNFSNFLSKNFVMKFFVASPFEEFEIDKKVMEMKAPSEDDGEEEGEASAPVEAAEVVELSNNDWTIFSRFIDRTLFLVLIAAFLIMEFSV